MNLGKNIIEDLTPTNDAVLADAADHQDWPQGALFKASYRTRPYAGAFEATKHVFFKDAASVKAWERDYESWTSLSPYEVEYTIYEWHLGPKVLRHNWF
jgi:hypothetical protein